MVEPISPAQVVHRQTSSDAHRRSNRCKQNPHSRIGQDRGHGLAGLAERRPAFGGHPRPQHPAQRANPGRPHPGGQPADIGPPHSQVTGPALGVRRVEHQVDALGAHGIEAVQCEATEDALTGRIGMGGRVDGADRREIRPMRLLQLPPQESTKSKDPVIGHRHPSW